MGKRFLEVRIAALALLSTIVMGCDSIPNTRQAALDSASNSSATENVDVASLRQSSEQTMQRYLLASLDRFSKDSEVQVAIFNSQQDWLNYRGAHCKAVALSWSDVDVRDEQRLLCEIELTQLRTMALWRSLLKVEDPAQSILPEPQS